MHFLNMIHIVQGLQRVDNLGMRFILLQHLTADRDGDGIYRQAAAHVGRILLNLINPQSQATDHRNEVLEGNAVCKFQMNFKMIGTIIECRFQRRKPAKDAQQSCKSREADRIAAHAQ